DYGERWQTEPATALQEAYQHGLTVGSECAAVGVDVVFSPVVDLDYGISEVIGNRAFHRRPEVVADLAAAMIRGLHDGGVTAVAKHFPGHGGVEADSHLQFAIDQREREQIEEDLYPYQKLIAAGLRAVMMAHVCFPRIDSQPAGYSAYWVEQLR
ncbi:MAG TPA: beta-N-acetylhexosaminidase, partial [Gammaproteobacteria bacterium]|nr:beta-N-acetylhexosaminidase [Gammaproteobacteria bacterium]